MVFLAAMQRSFPVFASILLVTGCSGGGTPKEAAAPSPADSAAPTASGSADAPQAKPASEAPVADGPVDKVPDKCADNQAEGICAPPRAFVKRLCGAYP